MTQMSDVYPTRSYRKKRGTSIPILPGEGSASCSLQMVTKQRGGWNYGNSLSIDKFRSGQIQTPFWL